MRNTPRFHFLQARASAFAKNLTLQIIREVQNYVPRFATIEKVVELDRYASFVHTQIMWYK